ncbi:MAG: 5-oxoprolinase subunit PxpB [Pseudomonadota bacterium]|nr:5-oxoprolinase subunit PxpB [Pseudomonadota bacterium]
MISPAEQIRIAACGDTALTVEFGNRIDRNLTMRVVAFGNCVSAARIEGVVEVVPTYRSLLVHYDPLTISCSSLEAQIRQMLGRAAPAAAGGRSWTIPACYEGPAAPDLDDVARRTGLTPEEVVSVHSEEPYFVYMLGFLPGFPYLGDLPAALELTRRDSPRTRVPAGSVAIALRMTGVYPLESPGGWHLIAKTPIRFFDHRRKTDPSLLRAGDTVRFAPVSYRDFETLSRDVGAGNFELKPDGGSP